VSIFQFFQGLGYLFVQEKEVRKKNTKEQKMIFAINNNGGAKEERREYSQYKYLVRLHVQSVWDEGDEITGRIF